MRNPGGLVCRRTAENSYDLGLGSTPGPLFPGRRSWQQPGSLCGGPSGQKEEVHWQPSEGTQPAPPARTQVAPSALSRAPRSSRHGACQETPESWEGPGQEPLTCLSVLRSRGWRGRGSGTVPPGQSSSGSVWRVPGDTCAPAAPASGTGCSSASPMHRACCTCLFSSHCWSGQASCSSFQFIKGPQPLLQHLKTQCWESQQWQG